MLKHLGAELTNICNLKCKNCPNSYASPPKGYMTEETLELAILYGQQDQIFQLHGHGESLLHPKMVEFTRRVDQSPKNFYLSLSTNGLLLTEEMLRSLLDAGLDELVISLHAFRSVDALVRAIPIIQTYSRPIEFRATHFAGHHKVNDYIDKIGMREYILPYLELPTTYFTWSGAVEGTQVEFPEQVWKDRLRRCWFIKNDICAIVKWDGSVIACCYDFNHVNYLGHVRDFPTLQHRPETYDLCRFCEPKMANEFR